MTQYRWREGGPSPRVSATVFGTIVERLADGQPAFMVAPSAIVAEARKPASPIRKLFNWNDAKAAEAHRCHQARQYLGMLEIVVVEQRGGRAVSSRAFYSVKQGVRGYMARDRILTDRDLSLQVLASAHRELQTYVAKFSGALVTFGNVIPRLNQIISDMQSEISQLTEAASKPKGRRRHVDAAEGARPDVR